MRQDRRLRIQETGVRGPALAPLHKLLHFFVFTLNGVVASTSTSFTLWLRSSGIVATRGSSTLLLIHRLAHAKEGLLQRLTCRFDAADIVGGKGRTNISDLRLQFALLLRGELIAQFGEALLGAVSCAIGQI